MALTVDIRSVAREAAKDEYTDYLTYKKLSEHQKKISGVLSKLAESELGHYKFWGKYCDLEDIRPDNFKANLLLLLSYILGTTFVVKFMERHEAVVIARYKAVAGGINEADRSEYERMIRDEEEHENTFAEQTKSGYLRYISFIILGLADAIVEISGIHAGSLGIYKSTEITGLAGVVAGAAASIAMASAAYAQAKQGFEGKASISAVFTGVSYFINALLLASPYFLTRDMFTALAVSLTIAVAIIAFTSYYNSIISGSNFLHDFAELAGVMLGATVLLYFFGDVVSVLTGL